MPTRELSMNIAPMLPQLSQADSFICVVTLVALPAQYRKVSGTLQTASVIVTWARLLPERLSG